MVGNREFISSAEKDISAYPCTFVFMSDLLRKFPAAALTRTH